MFDIFNYELLIAKLIVYGFTNESFRLIECYLTNRWHRTKINKSFSKWTEFLKTLPQGSFFFILQGSLPLLFNIYLNDLVFLVDFTEVCNFADDTTFCDKDLGFLINRLEHTSFLAIEWLQNNYMKLSEDNCHLLLLDTNTKVSRQNW